ncbi:type II secretion system protein [Gloeocapsopsis crepidinum LEGE 06123]|uniref:Type II secretion system protein n=1 Tax=Gloeocapsopsis crepidinum LEGE 06123 TaxID=588587 RepID=A0ABR9UW33_9CHRO|nr:hormogonium polysaccharide secretion pseudopilin HpsC [Gloeocapsopsis crepidinum]MBE9192507.1 type II secretion system protein [Gloeocapsopsis crepidinum LEGE 06123]
MINSLKLLRYIHTRFYPKLNRGFTLIELLVGIVLAGLVIAPLMNFMLNILATQRQEEAKANSEQEIQSTINYITQDLRQAIYIYDADGLNNTSTNISPGIKDQIPPLAPAQGCDTDAECTPVLVFWKREFKPEVFSRCTNESITCLTSTKLDDTFVYSLVAYYLVENPENETNSNTARIARFQINDGVKDPRNPNNYIESPHDGFQFFNLRVPGVTLKDKMNRWQKANENYTHSVATLVDFIDTSVSTKQNCPDNTQQVPAVASGFYACIDSINTTAQVHLRGNAIARIRNDATCDRTSVYCPNVSVQVQGRGLLSRN